MIGAAIFTCTRCGAPRGTARHQCQKSYRYGEREPIEEPKEHETGLEGELQRMRMRTEARRRWRTCSPTDDDMRRALWQLGGYPLFGQPLPDPNPTPLYILALRARGQKVKWP